MSDFLKCYLNYESAVKASGFENALSYEQSLPENSDVLGKLKFCRQCRNFLAHEERGFFEPSEKMCQFLIDVAASISEAYLPAKKRQKKWLIRECDAISAVCKELSKSGEVRKIPVFTSKGEFFLNTISGSLSQADIIKYASINSINSKTQVKDVMDRKLSKKPWETVQDITPVKDIPSDTTHLVTNPKGEITGWI